MQLVPGRFEEGSVELPWDQLGASWVLTRPLWNRVGSWGACWLTFEIE